MNRDDVIKMAREAEGQEIFADPEEGRALFYMDMESLERFAQLVAAQEREEISSMVADEDTPECGSSGGMRAAILYAIRNRGTA